MNEELIRRGEVLALLEQEREKAKAMGSWDAYHGLSTAMGILNREPAVEAVCVRHARWHTLQETKLTKTVECTHCNFDVRFKKKTELNIDSLPYCPACGAKMKECVK